MSVRQRCVVHGNELRRTGECSLCEEELELRERQHMEFEQRIEAFLKSERGEELIIQALQNHGYLLKR